MSSYHVEPTQGGSHDNTFTHQQARHTNIGASRSSTSSGANSAMAATGTGAGAGAGPATGTGLGTGTGTGTGSGSGSGTPLRSRATHLTRSSGSTGHAAANTPGMAPDVSSSMHSMQSQATLTANAGSDTSGSGGGGGGGGGGGASNTSLASGGGAHHAWAAAGAGGLNTTQLLIASLVQRLVKRLPHNTGESISYVENDNLTCSCVANLVSHSQYQLPNILRELLGVLDTLNKTAQAVADSRVRIDIMQSQLLVLQVLAACLIHYWRSSLSKTERQQQKRARQEGAEEIPQGWSDPPALEDGQAKQLLGVMAGFLRETATREETMLSDVSADVRAAAPERPKPGKDEDNDIGVEGATFAALALTHGIGLYVLHPIFPPERSPFPLSKSREGQSRSMAKHRFRPDASQSIVSPVHWSEQDSFEKMRQITHSIYRQASQVLFFISSSNWAVVSARIRNRLAFLSNTAEESPNTSELRLLECSNFNRMRLASIIQELNSAFPHLKRPAQNMVALVLRRSIWNWIQYHPAEFAYLSANGRRLEGAPDVLFDQISNLLESTRRKLIFWPVLTSLLILCPDILDKIAGGDLRKNYSGQAKKGAFLDTLRKSLRSAKLADVAALCCIDLCKAATATPETDSSIRLLAGEMCGDIREKMFDPRRNLAYTATSIEVPLLVEAFVALYRLDSQKTTNDLVPVLMNDAHPIAFKVALVKGCIQLASEQCRIPWNPSLLQLYGQVSVPLRATFKILLARCIRPDLAGGALKRSKPKTEDAAGRNEILASILQLWNIDQRSASFGIDLNSPANIEATTLDDDVTFEAALRGDSVFSLSFFMSLAARSPEVGPINRTTSDVINRAIHAHNAKLDSGFALASREASLHLTTSFTTHIARNLAAASTPAQQHHWLPILLGSLERKYLTLAPDMVTGQSEAKTYLPSHNELFIEAEEIEKALLLTLCSIDTDVCTRSMQICAELVRFRRRASSYHQYDAQWIDVYDDLGRMVDVQTGRVAQQKRIMSRLRNTTGSSSAVVAAWKEAYHRWSALTLVVARPLGRDVNDSAQEKAAQWHNFSGFLAILGGACAGDHHNSHSIPDVRLQATAAPHEEAKKGRAPIQLIETYVQEMVDLLVSDSIWVREKVKETLGNDLSLRLSGILLSMIHSVVSDFFDRANGLPKATAVYSVFVEHSIAVIQMLLARTTETNEATTQVDIGALMVLYCEYLNSLPKREQAQRVRTAMCQLCETVMHKKSSFAFNNELRVRNRLVQVLVGWTTESIEEGQASNRMDRLQRDLDSACLQTISVLLDKLPLLLPEDVPLLDDKVDLAKSRQFSTYFNFFIKVLNRAKAMEKAAPTTSSAQASSTIGGRPRDTTLQEIADLKQSTILALSNLLASNIDTGLYHSLPLAYQDDVQLRTALMQIMTNVLDQGTAFDRLEKVKSPQKQDRLVELLCEPDLQLALAVCNVCKGFNDGGVDHILLNLFDSKGGIIQFLKAALFEEIEKTSSEEMVFRSNSFRTHLLSTYGRTHGYEYLRGILGPLVAEMMSKPGVYSYEIDAQKLGPGEMVIVNQHRLEEVAQAFIDRICSSAHRVPAVMRELCRHIRQLMDSRFPSSRYQGVGGFIFLRFINPAVVAPQNIDIDVSSNKEVRRGLLLVSKILQTLASNTLFPQHKEPFMTSLNDFLKRNVWKITTFLDQVSDTRTDPERLQAADQPLGHGIHPFGQGIDDVDQRSLHRFFFDNADKISTDLTHRASQAEAEMTASNGSASHQLSEHPFGDPRRVHEAVCALLSEVVMIKNEASAASSVAELPRPSFPDFIRRYQGRNIDEATYKSIFREGPRSKAGRPVFYFTPWRLSIQTIDYENFIFYILTLLQNCNQPYDLLCDCTGAYPDNFVASEWLVYFGALAPPELGRNLRSIIGYNINTACRLYNQNLTSAQSRTTRLAEGPAASNISTDFKSAFYHTLEDLEQSIERRNIALDPKTVALGLAREEDRFDNITMVWYYRALIPVVFKITDSYLQITNTKREMDAFGAQGHYNEVFHLADIDDVRAVSIRGDDNTFLISCRGGVASFLFVSPNRANIVQGLRQAKARVSRFETVGNAASLGRTLLPSDVPGTLLNMAFLNVTSHDTGLRISAYNLLCALSSSFDFGASEARKRLHSAKGLALSANSILLISELSSAFAVAAPGVTMEFLTSFFEGFERTPIDQKIACLHYLAPWLPNLSLFTHSSREQQPDFQKRIREILSHLIAITVQEPTMFTLMQRGIWAQFSKFDVLVPTLLDVFVEAAIDSGLYTERYERIIDTMVSFPSINLRGKLLAKLRRMVARTAQNPTATQLHENVGWKEIATLVHISLALSFSNRLESMLFLPDMLHVILLLAGNGEDATRRAVHGMAVNLVHSLCEKDVPASEGLENDQFSTYERASSIEAQSAGEPMLASSRLRNLLVRLSSDEFLVLFGLPQSSSQDSTIAVSDKQSFPRVREPPSNQAIATLAGALYEIPELAAPSIDAANAWRARLTSLVTSKAFQYNPIIQARAFILLGCLADLTKNMLTRLSVASPDGDEGVPEQRPQTLFEVDDDLLYQILVSLRGSIQEWASASNDGPIVSIVTCLSNVVKILPDQSRYLAQMFWLGISIIQYGHVPLFKAGIDLLNATVTSICARDIPHRYNMDLITFLMDGRYDFHDAAICLDDETGVDFEINFSFGAAALLVKGLSHPLTRDATIELLRTLLQSTAQDAAGQLLSGNGEISKEQLGFFIALLPTATKDVDFEQLLKLAGMSEDAVRRALRLRNYGSHSPSSSEQANGTGLFSFLEPLENKIALLVITLLSSLLQQTSVTDAEKQLLYSFLADSARRFPAIVSILYDHLLPSMREVYLNSQNDEIVRSVDVIAQIAIAEPIFQLQVSETQKRGGAEAYLDESGYACLLDCGAFVPLKDARRVALAKLSAALLSGLIDAGSA